MQVSVLESSFDPTFSTHLSQHSSVKERTRLWNLTFSFSARINCCISRSTFPAAMIDFRSAKQETGTDQTVQSAGTYGIRNTGHRAESESREGEGGGWPVVSAWQRSAHEIVESLFAGYIWWERERVGYAVYFSRGVTPYNGLYGEAPPERGTFSRLQVYKRVGQCRKIFVRALKRALN